MFLIPFIARDSVVRCEQLATGTICVPDIDGWATGSVVQEIEKQLIGRVRFGRLSGDEEALELDERGVVEGEDLFWYTFEVSSNECDRAVALVGFELPEIGEGRVGFGEEQASP